MFEFATQTTESLREQGIEDGLNKAHLLTSADLQTFHLTIDTSPVLTTAGASTTISVASEGDDAPRTEVVYSKHTSFKGTRQNELGQTETLLLTLTPNSADYLQRDPERTNVGDKLNTQSTPQFDELSGRMPGQFTVQGYLITPQTVFHITTFAALEFQLDSDINAMEHQVSALKEQQQGSLEELDTKLNTLDTISTLLVDVVSLRPQAAYDLVLVDIGNGMANNSCGVNGQQHHHHDEGEEDYNHNLSPEDLMNDMDMDEETRNIILNPLSATPQTVLAKWTGCHRYMDRMVVFTIRLYASIGYQYFASGSTTTVNNGAVDAYTKNMFQIMNKVTAEQLSFIYKIKETVRGTAGGTEAWNTLNAQSTGCSMTNSLNAVSNLRRQAANQDVTSLHALLYCAGGGTAAGVANVGILCGTSGGGVSSITGSNGVWTLAHELGHQTGSDHSFGDDDSKQGDFGSIMDYGNNRLPATDANPNRIGFNKASDFDSTCNGLKRVLNNRAPSAQCYTIDDQELFRTSCGNGIIDPWESCDGGPCCENCKLKANATCNTNNECCQNCQVQGPKLCTMAGDAAGKPSGQCVVGGVCEKSGCAYWGQLDGAECPTTMHFAQPRASQCGYFCPKAGCQSSVWGTNTFWPPGSQCPLANNAGNGVCRVKADGSALECVKADQIQYSWASSTVAQCNCNADPKLATKTLFNWICVSASGDNVAESQCAGKTKPATPQCCCDGKCTDAIEGGKDPETPPGGDGDGENPPGGDGDGETNPPGGDGDNPDQVDELESDSAFGQFGSVFIAIAAIIAIIF